MSILIYLILALMIPQSGGQPEVVVSGVPDAAVEIGSRFIVEVRVMPGEMVSPEQIKLLPLALENLRQEQSRLTVETATLSYAIEFVAVEEGNAAVAELQFEILPPDSDTGTAPRVFYHEGFSVQVVRPMDWTWGGLLAGVFILSVVLGAVLAWRKQKKVRADELTRTDARRRANQKALEEIEALRISGEWEQVVEKCYQTLNRQVRELAELENSTEAAARAMLYSEIRDSEGLGRLGEEVRYADHRASLKEARFAEQVVQKTIDYLNKRHETKE
jgi:hypothetical protein